MERTERIENIENSVKEWNSKVSLISLWGPALLLLIEIIMRLCGQSNFSIMFNWLTPKLIISFIIYCVIFKAIIKLFDLNSQDLLEHDKTLSYPPRKLIHVYGLTAYKAVQKNIDYTKNVDLLLDNGLEMLSQKLFSSLITLTTIIVLTGSEESSPKLASCLSFFIITIILYGVSFKFISCMSNSKERKVSEYALLAICSLYNLLAATFFIILLVSVVFPYIGGWIFFTILYAGAALASTFMFYCFYQFDLVKINKLKQYLKSSDDIEEQL